MGDLPDSGNLGSSVLAEHSSSLIIGALIVLTGFTCYRRPASRHHQAAHHCRVPALRHPLSCVRRGGRLKEVGTCWPPSPLLLPRSFVPSSDRWSQAQRPPLAHGCICLRKRTAGNLKGPLKVPSEPLQGRQKSPGHYPRTSPLIDAWRPLHGPAIGIVT